jgi:hypothetical protein
VLKTDTQGTEILDKAISLDQEGASTQAQMADSGSSLYPEAVVPALHLGFAKVKGSQSFLIGKKAWGMG